MIINGGSRCSGGFFARHLMNAEKNERVKVVEIRSLAAQDVAGCLREMEAVASGTRAKNFFYHANINIPAHEQLTAEQWEKAVDRLERNLGLEGQPRFVIEHKKEGRTHQHVVWSRIDVDNMKAVRMSNDYAKHQETARELEKEFGLERGQSVLGPEAQKPRPERRPEQWEVFRGKKSGLDPRRISAEVTELWKETRSGKAFAEKLEGLGYVLARGDRRNFCLVDSAGQVHSLARRVKGAKAADIKERMSDIDPQSLPDIEQAKAQQKQQEAEREKEALREEEQRAEAIQKEEEARQQAAKDEETRQQAVKDEAARQEALEKEQEQAFKTQADRLAQQAKEMEQAYERMEAYKAEMQQWAEVARRQREAERESKAREGEISNAGYRYGQALGRNYDIRDPYGSLARSSMAEYGAFMQERQNLDRQIAREEDPRQREALELRKRIEAAEYMEITSNRIASQSEIIVGRRNTPEALLQRDRAAAFHEEAQKLRQEYRELYDSRAVGAGAAKTEQREPEKREARGAKEPPPMAEKERSSNENTAARAALKVEDRTPGQPRGNPRTLADYVKELPEKPPPRTFTKEQIYNDRAAEREHYKQLREEQNRAAALDRISQDMKANRNLNAEDVKHLSGDDLKKIKTQGDDYIRSLVQQHERQREKGRER